MATRLVSVLVLTALVLAGCAGANLKPVVGGTRTALPALAEAQQVQVAACPAGGILMKAAFDPDKDGNFALVYFGPPDLTKYPQLWIRLEGGDKIAAVLLVSGPKAYKVITEDELRKMYKSPCDLLGTPV